jgi:hypothetical protein
MLPSPPKLSVGDSLLNSAKKLVSPITDAYNSVLEGTTGGRDKFPAEDPVLIHLNSSPYSINARDLSLYSTTPYGFRFSVGDKNYEFWLPINPSNLSITTNFGNSVTPTLFGAVEERSSIKIYNIAISGNTGIAPRNVRAVSTGSAVEGALDASKNRLLQGRKGAENSLLGSTADLISQYDFTGGALSQFADKVKGAADSITGALDSLVGTSAPSGFLNPNSGYAAFHNFYRFLHSYQKLVSTKMKSGGPSFEATEAANVKLFFYNYKDSYKMHVSPQRFVMTRSAESPLLYNYGIDLIGMSLLKLDEGEGPINAQQIYDNQLKELGLDGVRSTTIKAQMQNMAGAAKGIKSALSVFNLK